MLTRIAWLSIALGLGCALLVLLDIVFDKRQKMPIMNVVWPITALYSGPIGLLAYFSFGRPRPPRAGGTRHTHAQTIALAATHCGSGCTLGDLVAEWALVLVPLTLFGRKIFAAWTVDYVLAFMFGIVFQYFTIAPMRGLGLRAGIVAAVKADALSLTAWQIGMYGWMAIATFGIFQHELSKTAPVFWFMMQIAMLCGFLTAYPVNAWLLARGLKEKM